MSNDTKVFNGLDRDQIIDLVFYSISNMSIEELDEIFDCKWYIKNYIEEAEYPIEGIRQNYKMIKHLDDLIKNKSP